MRFEAHDVRRKRILIQSAQPFDANCEISQRDDDFASEAQIILGIAEREPGGSLSGLVVGKAIGDSAPRHVPFEKKHDSGGYSRPELIRDTLPARTGPGDILAS
jgi:hypothetical protein